LCETTGTVLAAVRCADAVNPDAAPTVFQGPGFVPGRFFQMTFASTSANLLEHYRGTLPDRPSFDDLTRAAATVADADAAEIEPYDDAGPIEQCFRHVRPEHARGQVVRGILRRVALTLKQQVEALSPHDRPAEIRAAGGGARSDLWLQMKADLLGVPMVALECEEPTSLGAAILAAHGIGMGTVEGLARRWVRPRATFTPRR
jgi:sugar (pentulose or hexulose) kinase